MVSKTWKEVIELLKKKDLKPEEYEFLKTKCKKILQKALKSFYDHKIKLYFQKIYGSDYLEELVQEFLARLINNLEKFDHMETISEKYFITMAKNLILYELSLNKSVVKEESLVREASSIEEEPKIIEKKEELSYTVDYLENLIIDYFIETIKREFTLKELETICFYLQQIFCDKKIELPLKEKNRLYKRWERLKPKLQNFFSYNLEDVSCYIEKIFEKIWSEICKEINLSYIKDCF